jgi:hypothetical protein
MYVVAITRWGAPGAMRSPAGSAASASAGPSEQDVQVLAPILEVTPYDLRLRLAGPLPAIVTRAADTPLSHRLLLAIHQLGHGVVGCHRDTIPNSRQVHTTHHFGFGGGAFDSQSKGMARIRIDYADIVALVRARCETVEKSEASHSKRALLGYSKGGSIEHDSSFETEQVLYVFTSTDVPVFQIREHTVDYRHLEKLGATNFENFGKLVAEMTRRVPHALFDDRLATQKRGNRPTGSATEMSRERSMLGRTKAERSEQTVGNSNHAEVDLAAHLIALGHAQRQL